MVFPSLKLIMSNRQIEYEANKLLVSLYIDSYADWSNRTLRLTSANERVAKPKTLIEIKIKLFVTSLLFKFKLYSNDANVVFSLFTERPRLRRQWATRRSLR